jgi:hypothetical protein
MKPLNSLRVFGGVLLVAGLIGGAWLLIAWLLITKSRIDDVPDHSSTAQIAPVEPKREKDATEREINKLQELAAKLQSEFQSKAKELRDIKIRAAEDPSDEIQKKGIESSYQWQRELLLDDVRERANRVQAVRLQLDNMIEQGKSETEEAKNAKQILENRTKAFEASKESLRNFEKNHLNLISSLRNWPSSEGIDSLEQACEAMRDQLMIVNRQLILAKLRQLGMQESSAVEDINHRFDQQNREIRDLRKELQALKKQK